MTAPDPGATPDPASERMPPGVEGPGGPPAAPGTTPRPDAIAQAARWIRTNHALYAPKALDASLRATGYTDEEIEQAWRDAAPPPAPPDLRSRAAWILVLAFLGTWGVLSLLLLRGDPGYGPVAIAILTMILLPILGVSLAGVGNSDRLRRGVEGALVAVLALPFVLLVIVAGLCVMTTGSMMTT